MIASIVHLKPLDVSLRAVASDDEQLSVASFMFSYNVCKYCAACVCVGLLVTSPLSCFSKWWRPSLVTLIWAIHSFPPGLVHMTTIASSNEQWLLFIFLHLELWWSALIRSLSNGLSVTCIYIAHVLHHNQIVLLKIPAYLMLHVSITWHTNNERWQCMLTLLLIKTIMWCL